MKINQTTTTTVIEYELGEEVDAQVYPLDDANPVMIHTKRLRVTTTETDTTVLAWWEMADRWAEVTPGSENNLLSQLGKATR